ncbi:MAG: DUF3365 domain-containing protein [Candidatus Neomarinimicrobiota bacterium]
MNDRQPHEKTFDISTRIKFYIWPISILWTVAILLSLTWNIIGLKQNIVDDARLHALVAFDKDVIYRRWNARLGGVFAPVSGTTVPNPYLQGLTVRDVVTQKGDTLTKINPAYMTRQVHELLRDQSGVLGHITSLKPIRPENEADDWEKTALQAFESGAVEHSGIQSIAGVDYYRYMQPLVTESSCLPCHRQQGYQVGDIRGGISVSIPLAPLLGNAAGSINRVTIGHVLLWLIGVVLIGLAAGSIRQKERDRLQAITELRDSETIYRRLSERLAETNSIKELLLDIITHDLKNPSGVISGMAELALKENPKDRILSVIKESSDNLLKCIDNATTLSRISAGDEIEKEQLDLTGIITAIVKEFQPTLEAAEMQVSVELPEEIIVAANPIIAEVFRNYLSNAIRYAADGRRLVIGSTRVGENIEIAFKDFGTTIPESQYGNVFMRSVQLDKFAKRGRGLGLAIVKKIAEIHNAGVGIRPNQPNGNIFYISFPVK